MPRKGSQTPPASRNSLVLRPPSPPSPPAPRGGRGPGRGAPGPFANQKNRRAQNDLGRRPTTPYSAARRTRATARRRNGPRRSTTSLGDLRGRAAAPHGGPSRGSLIHNQLSARTSWTSSFVLFFPARPHVGAGRPVGSTPLRVRTVLFRAVMFLLHCYPHVVLLPRVSFPLLPSARKEL